MIQIIWEQFVLGKLLGERFEEKFPDWLHCRFLLLPSFVLLHSAIITVMTEN